MLDSGASISLVKKGALRADIPLENTPAKITGITPDTMHTLAVVTLIIRDHPYRFHVVDDDFPIKDDSFIGRGFLRREKAVLSYYTDAVTIRHDIRRDEPYTFPYAGRKVLPSG